MTKRFALLIATPTVFLVFVILLYGFFTTSDEPQSAHVPHNSSMQTYETAILSSFAALQKQEGTSLTDLGNYQITTIVFRGKPKVILTGENGNEQIFPVNVTNKEKNEITLPTVKYAPTNLVIAQHVGLAQKDNQYFMYIPSH